MVINLTNNEIDDVCIEIMNRIISDYPYYAPHVKFMYYYGCRVGELFDYRITFNGITSQVIIKPQKHNNDRVLSMVNAEIPSIVEQINITQDNSYLNKRNFQRIIEKVHPIRQLMCGNKKIGAHLFRHNYIKKLVSSGYQINTIDKMMGYTNQTVQDTYAISEIYY